LQAGQKYAFVALVKEGGGGDFLQEAMRKEGDTKSASSLTPIAGLLIGANAKPNKGDPQITKQPVFPAQLEEGKSYSFSVDAIVTPEGFNFQPFVQWQKNGTDIPGASEKTYAIASAAAADAGTYRAVVSAASGKSVNSVESGALTVGGDTTPPKVVGATAFPNSTKIGMMFDEALDAASAATAANYQERRRHYVGPGADNVANELTDEKNLVQLTVATALTADFTVTVSGVKDAKGNAMASTTVSGKILNLTSTDIGSPATEPGGPDPQAPSTVTTWGPGAYDVLTTGSNDYWNNADGFHFLWEPKTGSFDVKVRVVSVSPINNWSAGAIEVREGPVTDNGKGWELSRHYFAKVDYGGPDPVQVLDNSGDGADSYEFNARLAPGIRRCAKPLIPHQAECRLGWHRTPQSQSRSVPERLDSYCARLRMGTAITCWATARATEWNGVFART
jgi:hypothetical protein